MMKLPIWAKPQVTPEFTVMAVPDSAPVAANAPVTVAPDPWTDNRLVELTVKSMEVLLTNWM